MIAVTLLTAFSQQSAGIQLATQSHDSDSSYPAHPHPERVVDSPAAAGL
jgi:hypothetical protein